jgi:CH-like domain in sperm protein
MAVNDELSDEQLKALYAWIDAIPLSRPKRNIARDFSDGVLFAEVVAAYFPHFVELHNYTPANSMKQKVYNFETLNTRVLRKINYCIPRPSIEEIVNGRPGSVEIVLNALQFKMAKYREKKSSTDSPPDSPGGYHNRDEGYGNESQSRASAKVPQSGNRSSSRGREGNSKSVVMASVDEEILIEKEQQIRELQETVEILELKIAKLEQLVRLKDNKIQKLLQK